MRYKPTLDSCSMETIVEHIDIVDPDNGKVICQNFFPQDEVLSPTEMFDLTALVKSGKPLQKTNTKVLGTGIMAVADSLNSIQDKEINNE